MRLVQEAHGRLGNFHVECDVLPVSARQDERVLTGIHGCCAVVGDQLKGALVQAEKERSGRIRRENAEPV